jgi:hypothetical protein
MAVVSPVPAEQVRIRREFSVLRGCIAQQAKKRARRELGSKQFADQDDANEAARMAVLDCNRERARLIALPVIPYAFQSLQALDDLVHGLALDDARGELRLRAD